MTPLGRTRLCLAEEATKLGNLLYFISENLRPLPVVIPGYTPPDESHFLWVTEFPLFTRADEDKDSILGHGRWSSSHHPFTAPMWEDVEGLMNGTINPANVGYFPARTHSFLTRGSHTYFSGSRSAL